MSGLDAGGLSILSSHASASLFHATPHSTHTPGAFGMNIWDANAEAMDPAAPRQQPLPLLPLLNNFGGLGLLERPPVLPQQRGYYIHSAGSPTARRHPTTEVNHNKAITKRLASAVHYQQVLDVVKESVWLFDEVNVATALHRLAKLQPPGSSGPQSPVVYADQFQQLVTAIQQLMHRFEAQAVSNTLWAFATLAYHPEGDLLERLALHAASIMRTFRPQATSNTLWAFAKLACLPCEEFLTAASAQMMADLARSVPQDISNALWAFATLRRHPGRLLLDAAAVAAARTMPRFKPQEIANTLWAYATLGHDPGPALLDAAGFQIAERIPHFRPQAVSNSLWAYAKLGYNPGRELLDCAARRAVGKLHQYTSQEIANTLWALATLEHHPGAPLLDAAAGQIARRIDQFSPQDTTNSVWAFAKLFHHPCNELLAAGALYCLRNWHRFKPQEVANMLWALAILKTCPTSTWRALLDKLAQVPPSAFDDADLHHLFQTHILLQAAGGHGGGAGLASGFPEALLEAASCVWRASVRRAGRASKLLEDVSRMLWAMGVPHAVDAVTPDGLFAVDILLQGDLMGTAQVVIEVEGPQQAPAGTHRLLGRTVGRRAMLEAKGYLVRSIPFYEWHLLPDPPAQQQYLARLLTSALAPR